MTREGWATLLEAFGALALLYGLTLTWLRWKPSAWPHRALSATRALVAHVRARLFGRHIRIVINDLATGGTGTASLGLLVIRADPGADAPLAEQVDYLRQAFDRLEGARHQMDARQTADAEALRADHDADVAALRERLAEVDARLPPLALDGLVWAAGGAALTLAGVLLGAPW